MNNPQGNSKEDKPSQFGRPSEYKPEYCELVIEHMSKGYSFESFAGLLKASTATIYRWRDSQEDFRNAVERAFAACRLFWEGQGVEGLWSSSERSPDGTSRSKAMNAAVWKFNMQNRFKWHDNVKVEADVTQEDKKDQRLNETMALLLSEFSKK